MPDQMSTIASHIINEVQPAGKSENSRASAATRFKSLLPLDSVLPQACAASIVSA